MLEALQLGIPSGPSGPTLQLQHPGPEAEPLLVDPPLIQLLVYITSPPMIMGTQLDPPRQH